MKKNILLIFILIIFSLPSILPLFNKGFFQSDDGEWMIIRFSAFHQALRDGQFPVRFLSRLNYGYGYPVANFLYPGFMYASEPIHLLGFGFVNTIKIILGLSMIGSAIFCYLWLSKFFDKLSSFVGALFYLYTPYHLFDVYKRGSVGEVLSLAIVPFVLWQLERRSFFWSSIGIAFLILSHNTLAVLFVGLILIYMGLDIFISRDKRSLLRKYLLIFIFGFGISSFFWLPAFFELPYTVFSQTQISEWNKYFASVDLIGVSTIFVLLFTAFFFVTSKIKIQKHRLTVLLFVVSLVSVFFASSVSTVLWNILPVSFIQFPFRFLSVSILCVAFLSAVIVNQLKGNKKIIATIVLFVFLGFSAVPYIKPTMFFDKGESFYATNMDTTTVKNEYMPKWVKQKPIERFKEKVEVVEGVGSVNNLVYNSKKITFNVNAKKDMKVRINTIYYPGWNAKVNNQKAEINYTNEKGVIELNMPKGKDKVELQFSETPLRLFVDFLSLFSFIALILLSSRIFFRRI